MAAWHVLRTVPAGAEVKKELLQYDGPLSEVDPDIAGIITNEKRRQVRSSSVAATQQQQHSSLHTGIALRGTIQGSLHVASL